MGHKGSSGLLLVSFLFASLGAAPAQAPVSWLSGDWRSSGTATIPVNLPAHPMAGESIGNAPADMRLERMILLLEPSAAQKQALDQELRNQQNPASASYHRWLTPAAFADAYANSAGDVAAVAAWLKSEGFQVAPVPTGRGWIEFSGTVAQVEQAFQVQVALAAVNGGQRAILTSGRMTVPAALKPLVQGLVSLDGAVAATAMTAPRPITTAPADLAAQTSGGQAEALTPNLLAQLLHLDALHAAGTTGAGQTIAIVTRAHVRGEDVAAFRVAFGLSANPLQVVSGGGAQDSGPGTLSDREAATAAASWAGAAAPGAQILLVPAATTTATDGVDLSLAAIVDGALADTVSVGYSSCEAALSEAHQAFYATLYRQAASEGIAVIAAAGDSGASACHLAGSGAPVSSGYAVNALAATPWNTAAGVAAFAAEGTSSLAAWSPLNPADPAYAGGGGVSAVYAAPTWQPSGTDGSSQAGGRRLPDIALPTAIDSAASRGLAFCFGGSDTSTLGCMLVRSGGSSVSAAVFAGVAALIAQKHGPQGNLAPGLYGLSTADGVFSDVTQGKAQLACEPSSAGCSAAGKIGFAAEAGYDQATGLGGINAQALVAQWKSQPMAGGLVSVGLAITPSAANSTYNPAADVTLTASVVSHTGGTTPTGSVQFVNGTTNQPLAGSGNVNLDGNGNASLDVALNSAFSTLGSFQVQANYSGDGTYDALNSQPLTVATQKSCTNLTVVPATTTPTAGSNLSVTVNFTVSTTCGPPAGAVAPSGIVTLNVNGGVLQPYTAALVTSGGVTTASFTIPVSSTTNALQATYVGDSNYAAGTADQVTLTVSSTPTVTLTPATLTPLAGSSLQLTISVTPPAGSSTQATGTVTVTVDNAIVGAPQLTPGSPSSTAVLTIPAPTVGTHTLAATYSSNGIYSTATSPAVAITVSKGTTVTTVTATPPTLSPGTSETLTATIAPTNPLAGIVYTMTGSVSFYDGGTTLLGTVAVSSDAAALTGVKLANNISHSIVAIYSGDTNWVGSTSAALPLAASTLPDTVVLTSNVETASPGEAVILTATVTPTTPPAAGAEQNPTGNVIFYSGTTALGEAALVATPLTDASTATLTMQTLPGGQDTVYAVYAGDLYYDQETSNLLTLTVEDFTIAPASTNPPTNLTIVKGSSGSASFVITGLGGFNNEVQVVCAVPSQDDMTCTATPQQVTPTATVTFVVQTFATGDTTSAANRQQPIWPRAAGGTALAALVFFVLPFGKRTRIFADAALRRFCILLLLLVGLGAAGLGCNSASGVSFSGTPLGVATLKITANAYVDNTVVSKSVYLTVNVVAQQ